jgi:hypothetical protein
MVESYRSYVIRVRRHADQAAVRLDVEDLLGGRRVAVTGDEARLLAERLGSMIANGGDPRPIANAGDPRPIRPGGAVCGDGDPRPIRPSGAVCGDDSPAAPPATERDSKVNPSRSRPAIRAPASSP